MPEQAVNFDTYMPVIQRFVVVMYERTSSASVNEARLQLFAQRGREIDVIPPTEPALLQHKRTAIYQGALVWGTALDTSPKLPSPSDYGWLQTNGHLLEPLWTTLPEAAASCQELVHCKCKVGCRRACKCFKSGLPCTALCVCCGNCS